MNIGALIDEMQQIRLKRQELADQDKALTHDYAELESKVLDALRDNGLNFARGGVASAAIATQEVPNVEDWELFYQYINDNDMPFLLQRRPSAAAIKELWESGNIIPGVKPYIKTSVSLRKITKG